MKYIAIAITVAGVLATAPCCRNKEASTPPAERVSLKPPPSVPAATGNQSPARTVRSGRPQERDNNLLHTMR